MKDGGVEGVGGALGIPCCASDEGVEISIVGGVGLERLADGGVCVGDEESYRWGSKRGDAVADGVFGEHGPYGEFVCVIVIGDRERCEVK